MRTFLYTAAIIAAFATPAAAQDTASVAVFALPKDATFAVVPDQKEPVLVTVTFSPQRTVTLTAGAGTEWRTTTTGQLALVVVTVPAPGTFTFGGGADFVAEIGGKVVKPYHSKPGDIRVEYVSPKAGGVAITLK